MHSFSTLYEAKLLKRYKRFLADVIFKNGEKKTVYCPNPGSMLGLTEKNTKIWLEKPQNKKSKYNYIWRLVESDNGELICIDTQIANKVIKESNKDRFEVILETKDLHKEHSEHFLSVHKTKFEGIFLKQSIKIKYMYIRYIIYYIFK